jgi:alpha-L-rhamnosidase
MMPTNISSPHHWKAKWIWDDGDWKPYHFYLYARRVFDLTATPASGILCITASDRYVLYVNGEYVGRGPARSDPRRKSYDRYDVTKYLRPGSNTLAVRAYHYGTIPEGRREPHIQQESGWGSWTGNAYTVGERAGLWVQLDVDGDGAQTIGTDSQWRVQPARAWNREVGQMNWLLGSNEVFDANCDPPDWMVPEFDDAAWTPAHVIPNRLWEWTLLEEREIPLLRETEQNPALIAVVGEVIDQARLINIDIAQLLNEEIHFPVEHAIAKDPNAVLQGGNTQAEFQGQFAMQHGIRVPFIIIDFGRQVFGFPRIRFRAGRGSILDMTYGQILENDRIPPAARYGDRYIARDGEQTWEVAEYRQFRYLQITFRSHYAPIHVDSVSVNAYTYPAEQRGAFECSDPVLTRLWQACLDTTTLNMEDTMVHESYRERNAWATGDGCHGIHVTFAAFGNLPLVDRFLRMWPLSNRGDGMMAIVYPPKPPDRHIIPQFLVQWSTRVREHYLFSGLRWVLEELYPSVPPQIDWYESHRDGQGLLRDVPGFAIIDWSPIDLRGASFSTNALYIAGLEDAAWAAEQVGEEHDAQRWLTAAAEVRATLRDMFWNEEQGLFEDAHHEGKLTGSVSEFGNGAALLYGIATDEQAVRISQRIDRDYEDLARATPLTFGYVVDGLMARGFSRIAIDIIRRRFEFMVNATNNPTIWESWWPYTDGFPVTTQEEFDNRFTTHRIRPGNQRSLAHTGGVQTGYMLSKHVLGVMPTGPGFETCTIRPCPGELEFAKGTFPTPKGDIRVDWKQTGKGFQLTTALPDGVKATVVLNRDAGAKQEMRHNDVVIETDALLSEASVCITGGEHRIEFLDV